jgi:hypothetical protein
MNQLAIIKKHLKGISVAYAGIKTPETLKKAGGMVREELMRYEGFEMPSLAVSATLNGVSVLGGVEGGPEGGNAPKAKETGFPGITTTTQGGVTTVYPADYGEDKEVEAQRIIQDLTKEPATVTLAEPVPVETVGGWPVSPEVEVCGLAPNRRHIRAKLGDGRVVTVERSMGRVWTNGERVKCRLIRAGGAPLFRFVG